jgi:hypothetical protein
VQRKKAEKMGARVLEDRIGWIYEPLTGEERAFISGTRLKLKRREVPTGWVTIRAYGYDPVGGRFAPLTGSLEVELPVK